VGQRERPPGEAAFQDVGVEAGAYFFLPAFDTAGVMPAVARTFGFSFLGFLASLLDFI
jgi:hypothetical protein